MWLRQCIRVQAVNWTPRTLTTQAAQNIVENTSVALSLAYTANARSVGDSSVSADTRGTCPILLARSDRVADHTPSARQRSPMRSTKALPERARRLRASSLRQIAVDFLGPRLEFAQVAIGPGVAA